ncbi:Solute carrier family 35 member F6 [Leucoagaricus sp. SymC.cos]|nr:Solute carrier family 35 member F6 [Leucoagaricus sp. SymC.cos]
MPSTLYIPFLLVGMIVTGASNSLWSKWQDMQCVENCSDPDPTRHVLYEQPVWQTLQMFLGEMLCFLPVIYAWVKFKVQPVQLEEQEPLVTKSSKSSPLDGWKVLLLWIPAACDLTGTTLMNVGLLYTPVSVYQMTRGALVLFVGVFSVIFLRRHLWLYQWISLIIVMGGVALVGYSGSLVKDVITESLFGIKPTYATIQEAEEAEAGKVVIGVFFVLFAQIFTATQFVVEAHYSVTPLMAVGYEGFFGALSIFLLLPILSIPSISKITPFFDLPRGWYQTIYTPSVLSSSIAIAISIALFNFFGLSVTRHVSATARSLTDTCRTLAIWIVSLGLGWEKFLIPISFLQLLGFTLLVYGTFLFNNLVSVPPCLPKPDPDAVEREEDLEELLRPSLDETAALPADLGQSGYDVVPGNQHAVQQPPSKSFTPLG